MSNEAPITPSELAAILRRVMGNQVTKDRLQAVLERYEAALAETVVATGSSLEKQRTEQEARLFSVMQEMKGLLTGFVADQKALVAGKEDTPSVAPIVNVESGFPEFEIKENRIRFRKKDGNWSSWLSFSSTFTASTPEVVGVRGEDGATIATPSNPLPVTVDSAEEEHTHAVATITASGNTDIVAPTSGKKLKVYWISAISDPDSSDTPLFKIGFGTSGGAISSEKYRGYALAKRQLMIGGTNQALIMNLSAVGSVAVTVIYDEVD